MRLLFVCLLSCLIAAPALAQTTQTIVIQNGKAVQGGGLQIGNDLKLMFAAQQKVIQRDFRGAELLYDQAIAANGGNIDAYLQRAVVRRGLGNEPGVAADATAAINLTNRSLQANPNNPLLYYQRGMGYRLLRDYPQAKTDIENGIRLGGKPGWQTDLAAIDMEAKEPH